MNWVVGGSYRIVYESESGKTTERTIDLLGTSRAYDGRVFLRAYCHLRDEERTFRADRVLRAERLGLSAPSTYLANQAVTPMARPALAQATPIPRTTLAYAATPSAAPAPRYEAPPSWTAACSPEPSTPRRKWSLGQLLAQGLVYGIGILMIGSCLNGISSGSQSSGSWPRPYPNTVVTPGPAPRPTPAPPPKPALEETTIAGTVLRTIRNAGAERYEVPALGLSTYDKSEAVLAIRLPRFLEATGLANRELVRRYLAADLNGSGKLSFDELDAFQKRTYRDFRYEANDSALRPDEFLAAGGGDCEGFALYTAGLLRFWGWEPYLGCLGPSRLGEGHAVCLSYEEGSFSPSYAYFTLDAWRAEDGTALPSGRYVPIDYDEVGGLTNAVKPGWKLRAVYVPEEAWGLPM